MALRSLWIVLVMTVAILKPSWAVEDSHTPRDAVHFHCGAESQSALVSQGLGSVSDDAHRQGLTCVSRASLLPKHLFGKLVARPALRE